MGAGYMGTILTVDLTTGEIREESIPDGIYEQYLSGVGLAAYLLYHRIPAGADPLGPDNILGFVSGLLTGTGSLFAGRWMVTGKSPLTGGWGDANCGGNFSPAIKRCGFDGIFFKGVSDRPVYLHVENGKARLHDASHLWGIDAVEAEEILIREHGPRSRVALIGPAGERLSLISGICNDKGRIAARSGLGAVMGSKKLKAVVLSGAKRIPVHNRNEIKRLSRKCNRWVQFQPPFLTGRMMPYLGVLLRMLPIDIVMDGILWKIIIRKWGTCGINQAAIQWGALSVKNWKGYHADFDIKKSSNTNPDLIKDRETIKYHCYACPLGCGGICSMKGPYPETHKPELETSVAFGGLLLNRDMETVFYINELLNRAGMDSLSAAGTVAFAMECYEKGLLTKENTGGLDLTWGNSQTIVELVRRMIGREGIGDLLADGSRKAAERIGQNSIEFAIQAGGQEPSMWDGRWDPGFALHYSVEPTPGRHSTGSDLWYGMFGIWKRVKGVPRFGLIRFRGSKYDTGEKRAAIGAASSKFLNVINGAGLCFFGNFLGTRRVPIFEWLNAATGWNKTPEEYMEIGERIQTIRQAFNVRQGIEPKRFMMSARALGTPPLLYGANRGRVIDIEKMAEGYWGQFGWDTQTGKPGEECLKRLDIELR